MALERREMQEELHALVSELHNSKQPNPWLIALIPVFVTILFAVIPVVYYAGQFDTVISHNRADIAESKTAIDKLTESTQKLVEVQHGFQSDHIKINADARIMTERAQDRYDHLIANIGELQVNWQTYNKRDEK